MFPRPMFAVLLAVLLAATLGAAATAAADPPVGKARAWRYVYYPEQQLYYSTEVQIWFWRNGNGWSYGVHLPAHLREQIGTGIPVTLATDRPFRQHAWVEQQVGKPWRADRAAQGKSESEAPESSGSSDAGNG